MGHVTQLQIVQPPTFLVTSTLNSFTTLDFSTGQRYSQSFAMAQSQPSAKKQQGG
jgi:hypothetical protein